MMRWPAIAMVVVAAACHAQLENSANQSDVDAPRSNGSDIDAANGGGGGGGGGGVDAPSQVQPDAAPACASGRVVYLEFNGATLTKATTSDATHNKASWMGVNSATLPGYKANASNRAQLITDVTNLVIAGLASYPNIAIVTTRPAAGPYVMIGFGGVESTVNIPYRYAVQKLDCGDTVKSDLGWVFDDSGTSQGAANDAIGAIGFGLGLVGTTDPNDCMCGWLSNCSPSGAACTLSASIPALNNCNMNPQNEIAAFQAFCN